LEHQALAGGMGSCRKDSRSITNEDTRHTITKRLDGKFKRYGRVWPATHLAIKGVINESTRSEVLQIFEDYNASPGSVPLMDATDFPDEYLQKLRLAVSGVASQMSKRVGTTKSVNFLAR
jgi:hypothetical protein